MRTGGESERAALSDVGLARQIGQLIDEIAAVREERTGEAARLARVHLAVPHFAKRSRGTRLAGSLDPRAV